MGNNITQRLKYKESVVKFSYKYGVTKTSIKFNFLYIILCKIILEIEEKLMYYYYESCLFSIIYCIFINYIQNNINLEGNYGKEFSKKQS